MTPVSFDSGVNTAMQVKNDTRHVKRSSNFRTSVLKFEFEFDLHTYLIIELLL